MSAIEDQIHDLLRRWVQAEPAGDIETLDALACEDFRLVGPAGFVLDKQQWLERYRSGSLHTTSLGVDDLDLRLYEDTAIVIGTQTQTATYQGHPAGGDFRTTHVVVLDQGRWRLAGQHLSPIVSPDDDV